MRGTVRRWKKIRPCVLIPNIYTSLQRGPSTTAREERMRSSLIAPIALTLAAYGQEGLKVQPQPKAPPPGQAETQRATPVVRRLESITWNPVTGELSWVVA